MKRPTAQAIEPYLHFQGIVAGDPHVGNFSVIPVLLTNGDRALRYLDIDFDDIGLAPFAFDFARVVIAVKADSGVDVKVEDLLRAYLMGLVGQSQPIPQIFAEAAGLSSSEIDRRVEAYVADKTRGNEFKYSRGKLEPINGQLSQSDVAPIFARHGTLLDLAIRPKERGGSVDGERFWALVRVGNRNQIFELKERQTPGTASYGPQPEVSEWLRALHATFWPGVDGSSYTLVDLRGKKFWLRDKKVDLVELPESGRDREQASVYMAWHLGTIHGRQPQASAYREAIAQDPAAFKEAVKALKDEYLEFAEKTLRRR